MAKKTKLSIADTLANKVELKKEIKDVQDIADEVGKIHSEQPEKSVQEDLIRTSIFIPESASLVSTEN